MCFENPTGGHEILVVGHGNLTGQILKVKFFLYIFPVHFGRAYF
jgi:hypothetical protein